MALEWKELDAPMGEGWNAHANIGLQEHNHGELPKVMKEHAYLIREIWQGINVFFVIAKSLLF